MKYGLPFVSIIIPVINGYFPRYLIKSLNNIRYPKTKLEIIIVEILNKIEKVHLNKIRTIRVYIGKKIGFGEAVNTGIKKSRGNAVFIINSDVLINDYCLKKLVRFYEKFGGNVIVGPSIYSSEKKFKLSSFDTPGFGLNPFLGKLTFEKNYLRNYKSKREFEVLWISGSAMLFSKETWEKVGKFDEKFFLYWEDSDFCTKAKKKGIKVYILSTAKIWHYGSASIGRTSYEKIYYIIRNNYFFIYRYSNILGKTIIHLRNLFLISSKTFQYFFVPSSRDHNKAFLLGILDFYKNEYGVNRHKSII